MTYGEGTMKRFESIDKSLVVGIAARSIDRPRATQESQTAAWAWSAAISVLVWSVSYLVRQPGVVTSTLAQPFSPVGDFALEGMLLALVWLGLLAAACVAILTGAVRVVER